jgi:hypothetical protein
MPIGCIEDQESSRVQSTAGRPPLKADNRTGANRLPTRSESLDISQSYKPQRLVTDRVVTFVVADLVRNKPHIAGNGLSDREQT